MRTRPAMRSGDSRSGSRKKRPSPYQASMLVRYSSGREGFGHSQMNPMPPESNDGSHFQKLHGDAPPAHATRKVRQPHAPPARFPAAATAIERAAEPHPEAARENAGAKEIPEDASGNVERPRDRERTGSHRAGTRRRPSRHHHWNSTAFTGVFSKIERMVNEQVIHARAGQAMIAQRASLGPRAKAGSPTIARERRSRKCRGKCQGRETP